jgi:hypothetical protein
MNNHSIESALELGIMTCLKSIQVTNPSLLLTANQLKETIRDTRYVPAVAASMAFIVSKSNNPALPATVLQALQHWSLQANDQTDQDQTQSRFSDSMSQSLNNSVITLDDEPINMSALGQAIEERFRFVISASKKPAQRSKKIRTVNRRQNSHEDRADEVDLDEFLQGEPESQHGSQMSEDVEDTRQELLEQISLTSSRLSLASFASSSDEPMENASSVEAWEDTLTKPGRRLEPDENDYDDDEWW